MSKHHAVMQGMWSYIHTFRIVMLGRVERLPKFMLALLPLLSAVHFNWEVGWTLGLIWTCDAGKNSCWY